MRRISCLLRLSLLPEMGQRARIFVSETQWLSLLKCLATGWFASLLVTARRCSPNLVLKHLRELVKHATSTAWYTVDEMGRGARELVLNVVNKFWCRNSGKGIYKLTSFTLAHSTRESVSLVSLISHVLLLDILVSINGNRLITSVFYKPIDSHSYFLYSSSHRNHTKQSIPFSQFLRLRRLCSEDEDFESKSLEMREFFVQRGFPTSLLDTAFSKASQIPRSETLSNSVTNVTDHNRTPLVLTFHPFNFKVRDVIRKNFHILKEWPWNIFHFLQ